MPIIGLTDRGAAFPQIGVLRKGAPKVSDRQPGKDLDHFRFDTEDPDAARAFADAYGATPRAVNIYLPYATLDENFSAWQEHWVAGGLRRRCDGQTCVLAQTKDGKYDQTPHPCVCATLPADSKERCKPVGRLQVIIPELRRLAYVMALTTSIHDIKNLSQQLTALELSNGTLRGVPLVLRRSPVEISMPGNDGKRVRREKWLLSIEAAPRWVGLQLQAMEQRALSGAGYATTSPAPALPALAAPAFDEPELPPRPPAPPIDEDGAVIEDAPPAVTGSIEAEPVMKFNAQGQRYITLRVAGADYLVKDAPNELAFLEAGDSVVLTWHEETNRGKTFRVVDTIDGPRDADGDTPWSSRAATAGDGASFTPADDLALPAAA